MPAVWDKLVTLNRLGLLNIFRVGVYHLLTQSGYYRIRMPGGKSYSGPFWDPKSWRHELSNPVRINHGRDWHSDALRVLSGELSFFSSEWRNVGFPPSTNKNVPHAHWTKIDEFSIAAGDIKILWESSRFDGLLILALAWLQSGDPRLPQSMECWMGQWVHENPANLGIQWKCGQETAIRVMQVLLVARLLHRHANVVPTPALYRFVIEHCRRIAPTMLYAVAQDNNHGTSEAAALFMAGLWLRQYPDAGNCHREARRWHQLGRKWLENRVGRLVMADGSFSQHSVNYHRLMLDTVAMAEWWRKQFDGEPFSRSFLDRCQVATSWLASMIDPLSGDAPNLGANDGARLFVLHGLPYRDFRPTVQLASVLFRNRAVYPDGPWDEPLRWLSIATLPEIVDSSQRAVSQLFVDGGYVKLVAKRSSWVMLRLPRYFFRPSHSDALHIDLWHEGMNIIRDGGSFSYNANEQEMSYFPGTASHSTVQFDGHDQMPRLGRFLFGNWLKWRELVYEADHNRVTSAYRDYAGGEHRRTVILGDGCCKVVDAVSGFSNRAVLRWRLTPGDWRLERGIAIWGKFKIAINTNVPIVRAGLTVGWESRYYGQKTELPVFEVEIHQHGELETTISWEA